MQRRVPVMTEKFPVTLRNGLMGVLDFWLVARRFDSGKQGEPKSLAS